MLFKNWGRIAVAAVVLLIAATFVGSVVAAGGWTKWRAARYAARASALVGGGAKETARRAGLRALALDRDSIAATRTLLALLPPADLTNGMLLRARLADLQPDDSRNLAQLAITSIYARRFDMAERAISDLAVRQGEGSQVRELRVRLAAARGDFSVAEREARQLLAGDPTNVAGRLIVALAAVFTNGPTEAAERELTELSSNEAVRVDALRGLRELATRRGDRVRARELSEKIAADARADFADHLTRAEFVVTTDGGHFDGALLKDLTSKAGKDAQALGQIAVWLRRHGRGDQVEAWVSHTPALQDDTVAGRLIRAENFAAQRDWARLDGLLADARWEEMEFLRLALRARSARNQRDESAASREWRAATAAALEQPARVRALIESTRDWKEWESEVDEFLWHALQSNVRQARWVLGELQKRAILRRDTRALRRISEAMIERYPSNDQARNNLAFYRLLLGERIESVGRSVESLYAAHGSDAAVASTYALWLLRSQRAADALAALEKLSPEVLSRADIAPYYALALAGAGNNDKARALVPQIDLASLLPEERELLREAKLIPPES